MVTKSSGDSSFDDVDANDGGGGGGGGGDGGVSLPSWVKDFGGIARKLLNSPAAWVISVMTGLTFTQAVSRLEDQNALVVLVDEFVFQQFLLPAARAIWAAGLETLEGGILLFFGGDGRIGIEPGSRIGLLDIPVAIGRPVVIAVGGVFDAAIATIGLFNQQMALTVTSNLGIASAPVVAALWTAEIGSAALTVWFIVNFIDIPLIRPVEGLAAVTQPVRNFINWLT